MPAPKYSRYYTYIKPVVQNKFVKSSASHIFSLIAVIVFTVFAIRPTISTILNLQKSIQNSRETLAALDTKAKNLAEGRRNLDNLDDATKQKINTLLPKDAALATLINSLQNSSDNQATVSALQIQPFTVFDLTAPASSMLKQDEIKFSYNAQGSYKQLLSIIYNLRRSPRLVTIDNLVIGKQGNDPLTLSITGRAYFLR